jgi:hypothetical protein
MLRDSKVAATEAITAARSCSGVRVGEVLTLRDLLDPDPAVAG